MKRRRRRPTPLFFILTLVCWVPNIFQATKAAVALGTVSSSSFPLVDDNGACNLCGCNGCVIQNPSGQVTLVDPHGMALTRDCQSLQDELVALGDASLCYNQKDQWQLTVVEPCACSSADGVPMSFSSSSAFNMGRCEKMKASLISFWFRPLLHVMHSRALLFLSSQIPPCRGNCRTIQTQRPCLAHNLHCHFQMMPKYTTHPWFRLFRPWPGMPLAISCIWWAMWDPAIAGWEPSTW